MDSRRFDALTKTLARVPQSRRSAVRKLAAAGLGGVGGGLFGRVPAKAQETSPVAGTPMATGETIEFLYIQTFTHGTMVPKEGEEGVYLLELMGGSGHVTYFADRPRRETGIAPTERVLAAVGIGGDDPPNAGLVVQTEDGERVVIFELLAYDHDENTGTVTYDVRPLADYDEAGLAHLADKTSDEDHPASFDAGSLFIDGGGCPYWICGGICCDFSQGMVCQADRAYCVSTYQSGVCQGGDACRQGPHTTCNWKGTCHCGTDVEGGGACLVANSNLCGLRQCSSSGDCPYGKLCINAPCCGGGLNVCMALCQD